jgi:hypothetical protein
MVRGKRLTAMTRMPRVGRLRPLGLTRRAALALIAALVCGATAARGVMTLRLNLAQMVSTADRAFAGRVVSVHSGRDTSGLPSTWVTFAVDQVIKGTVGSEVTMKQFGTLTPLSDGSVLRLPGLPAFARGEEMVVFLSGESDAGFSSPIGMAQGKFPILRRGGQATVRATAENVGVLQSVQRLATPHAPLTGEITLRDFLDRAAQLVAEQARRP